MATARLPQSLAALVAALVCMHANMAATRVAATLWLLQNGYAEIWVGALLGLFGLGPLLLALWAGRQADRHGLQRPLRAGMGLGVLGAAAAWIHPNLATLAVAALACGGGLAVAIVAIQREAGHLAGEGGNLRRVFSWVALGPGLSNAAVPPLVGLLIDHAGYGWAFALALVMPVWAWLLTRNLPARAPTVASEPPPPAWSLLANPLLRRLLLVNLALSSCWDAHALVAPVLGHARGYSAAAIGLILGSFAVAATLVRLVIARWAERLSERAALRTAMLVAAAGALAYAALPGVAGLAAGAAVLGLALGSVQPMILSLLHQVTPAARHGQALGLRMLMVNATTLFMPLLFGWLAAQVAPGAPLWLMAAVVLAGRTMVPHEHPPSATR